MGKRDGYEVSYKASFCLAHTMREDLSAPVTADVPQHAEPCVVSGSTIKTPRYGGKMDWEAFHAQFELLAGAAGWRIDEMALQLAMCLTGDALSCLLLLSPVDRGDYDALVGA